MGLAALKDVDPDAMIIYSDVDEIVSWQHLQVLKTADDFPINAFVHFDMPLSYYNYHWNISRPSSSPSPETQLASTRKISSALLSAMPERHAETAERPFVGPLSSKCPASRASEYSGCSAAAHPCSFDAAFKFTAATTSLRRSIHIDSDPGRPEAGRRIGPQQEPAVGILRLICKKIDQMNGTLQTKRLSFTAP